MQRLPISPDHISVPPLHPLPSSSILPHFLSHLTDGKEREKAIRGGISGVREGMGQNQWRGKGVKRRNSVCSGWPDSLASLGKGMKEKERGERQV